MSSSVSKILSLVLLLPALFSWQQSFAADYVGSSACAGCHADQNKDWQGSHHDMAMRHATDASVKGDFNSVTVEFAGRESVFFRKDTEF